MKCGNCKNDHATVAMVQMCYHKAGRITGKRTGPKFVARQDRHHEERRRTYRDLERLVYRVEPGGYAIRNAEGNRNDISFYVVHRPVSGEQTGQTLVFRRSSDEQIPLSVRESTRVMQAIVADPQDAALLFGQKLGKCPECGHTLTRQESRERGIGPKCAKKRGWSDLA